MTISDIAIIKREVEVTTIPYGEKLKLLPGQGVLVTQAKGSNFTLNVMGNLVCLDRKDTDAIGREIMALPSDSNKVKAGDIIDKKLIWEQLRTIYDPEIPVNIVDLGLIYNIAFNKLNSNNYHIGIHMTLTAPGCGMGPIIIQEIEEKLKLFSNIEKTDIVLVFDPPWNSEMMTEIAKLELGLF